jgi:acetyl-CoA carboxylase carboxyl transferase subunit alpha
VKAYLIRSLRELADLPREELLQRRYDKFRKIGIFEAEALEQVVEPSGETPTIQPA